MRVDAERAVEEAGDEANSPEDRSSPNAQVDREATPGDAKRKLRLADGEGAGDVDDGDGGAPATFERRRKKCKTGSPGGALGTGRDTVQEEQHEDISIDKENVRMMKEDDFGTTIVGKELVVYWAGKYNAWYRATVQRFWVEKKNAKMTLYYPKDNFKDTIDTRKVQSLIEKGWIKVCDVATADEPAAPKDLMALAFTPSTFEGSEKKAGCSKCRFKGCRACRGPSEQKVAHGRQGDATDDVEDANDGRDGNGVLRPMRETDFGPSLVGKRLSVFWGRKFQNWYSAEVESFNKKAGKARLYYPGDAFKETVNLQKIQSLIKRGHIKIVADDEDGDLVSQLSHHTNDDEDMDLSQELSQEEGLRYVTKDEFGVELQGRTLSVFWGRGFNAWFRATVQRFDDKTKKAYLYYAEDNHHETVDAKKFANLVSKARIKLVEDEVPVGDPEATKEVVRLMTRQDLVRGIKGQSVAVFWTDEKYKGWYEATVRSLTGFNNKDEGFVKLYYAKDKTSETIDPTLMYIPEGRIGFIEERPGDHQLVRGEIDVALIDIKGRVKRSKGAQRKSNAPAATAAAVAVAGEERDEDEDEDASQESEEDPSPSQEDEAMGDAGAERNSGDCADRAEDGRDDGGRREDDAQPFEFGYDDYDGDDGDDGNNGDVQEAEAAVGAAAGTAWNPSTSVANEFIPDSHVASPNPSLQQLVPMLAPREANLPAAPQQLDASAVLWGDQGDQGDQGASVPEASARPAPFPAAPPPEAEQAVQEASTSQPSVDPWENNSAALVYRWVSTSLAHPLSKQAQLAKLRPSLQEAVEFIRENVRDTIEKSFNNSILIVGAPGSGKTLAVSRVIGEVQAAWNADPADPRVGIVRLSGVEFSDERAAFREIARQLCETLNLEYVKTASLGDNIQFLLQILKALNQAGKAAVFILEEFDLFAHTQKQTFLYCLLDSLQKSQAKAVVVGTTCRHDCLDLLEKRVKSRFSHRSVTLTPPTALEDGDVEGSGVASIVADILSLPETTDAADAGITGGAACIAAHAPSHNQQVRLAMEDSRVLDRLSRIVQFSNSLHTLSRIARKALAIWYAGCSAVDPTDATDPIGTGGGPGQQPPTAAAFTAHHLIQAMDDILATTAAGFESVISKLCPLDLSLLAAAYKARSSRTDGQILNFEMIHHEFKAYTTSTNLHVDNYSRAAASKSFERLVDQGVLRHPRNKGGSLSRRDRHYAPVLVQVTRRELEQGIQAHFNAPRQLVDWAIRGQVHSTALNEYN